MRDLSFHWRAHAADPTTGVSDEFHAPFKNYYVALDSHASTARGVRHSSRFFHDRFVPLRFHRQIIVMISYILVSLPYLGSSCRRLEVVSLMILVLSRPDVYASSTPPSA